MQVAFQIEAISYVSPPEPLFKVAPADELGQAEQKAKQPVPDDRMMNSLIRNLVKVCDLARSIGISDDELVEMLRAQLSGPPGRRKEA